MYMDCYYIKKDLKFEKQNKLQIGLIFIIEYLLILLFQYGANIHIQWKQMDSSLLQYLCSDGLSSER